MEVDQQGQEEYHHTHGTMEMLLPMATALLQTIPILAQEITTLT